MASDKFTSSFTGDLTEIERDYQQGRHINDLFTYLIKIGFLTRKGYRIRKLDLELKFVEEGYKCGK